MNPNFLLTSELSRRLYHDIAEKLPIIDYHNHISPLDVIKNRHFENIAKLWVVSDPYKHRAMRILGVAEDLITGNASDFEKFSAWYNSLPRLIGNPLFDWSVMELSTVFDYELFPLTTAEKVWNDLNEKLKTMSAQSILEKFNIEYSAPCVSITDNLDIFSGTDTLNPSLRGDNMILPCEDLISSLSKITGLKITSVSDYMNALEARLNTFVACGCKFSDLALDNGFAYVEDDGENDARFKKHLFENSLTEDDLLNLRSYIIKNFISICAKKGLTVQLHIGAQRYTSMRLRTLAGPAGGYAAIGNSVALSSLTALLDSVEKDAHELPKIILFTLNPTDNALMATLSGSYSKDGTEALVTQGPAWWWCDHYQGIKEMLDNFACHSVLSTFIGMTTDSRSLLSFVRHDYFRRVLCEWIANMVSENRLPDDFSLLAETVLKMCYKNAKSIVEGRK